MSNISPMAPGRMLDAPASSGPAGRHSPRGHVLGRGPALPPACPSISGGNAYINRMCWADPFGSSMFADARCAGSVDPDDDLGLCSRHVSEICDKSHVVTSETSW